MPEYPEWFIQLMQQIPSKRPRIVAEHILAHGSISTDELKTLYGYQHPPRAARDLRELGVPLVTERTQNAQGRSIAVYRFGEINAQQPLMRGRRAVSKVLKQALLAEAGNRCAVCGGVFDNNQLQVDHRIPYLVDGERIEDEVIAARYQVLCASCNRSKSWACEHCHNSQQKDVAICRSCYWAHPEGYEHVALQAVRRLDLTWQAESTLLFDQLQGYAESEGLPLQMLVQRIISEWIKRQLP